MSTTDRPEVEEAALETPVEVDPVHFGIDRGHPWPDDVPKGQDDTWWRYQHDPRGARRAEIKVLLCWSLAILAGIGLAWVYVAGGQPQVEGTMLFIGFGGLGYGFILWARDLLPGHDITASRGTHGHSSEADRQAAADALSRATDNIARRPFLGKALAVVGGIFGIAAFFPIASLGPRPGTILYRTAWGVGTRLVTEDGVPIRPGDLPVNGIMTAFPASNPADPQGPVVVINISGYDYRPKPGHEAWNVGGLVAFSKICTHAACPVGLYNTVSHQLVCPCHQSTFNVLTDCTPVFGPAPRALPQLPLALDDEGFLISQTGFDKPVGPGFWNRG